MACPTLPAISTGAPDTRIAAPASDTGDAEPLGADSQVGPSPQAISVDTTWTEVI